MERASTAVSLAQIVGEPALDLSRVTIRIREEEDEPSNASGHADEDAGEEYSLPGTARKRRR